MMLAIGQNRILRNIGIAVYGLSVFAIGINALGTFRTGVVWSVGDPASLFLTLMFVVVSTGAVLISWRVLFRTLDTE